MTTPNTSDESRGSSTNGSESGGGDGENQTVSYETHRRLLNEKKILAEKAKKQEEDLAAYRAKEAEIEKKKLEDQGEYQKILKNKEEEVLTLKQKLELRDKEDTDRKKLSACLKSVGVNLHSKFYSLIDFEEVAVNPETGEIDESSVKKVVDQFKTNFPEVVQASKGTGPKTDNTAPHSSANSGKIARSEWLKLPAKEMKKYRMDQIDENA